jgi:hypothetical protein
MCNRYRIAYTCAHNQEVPAEEQSIPCTFTKDGVPRFCRGRVCDWEYIYRLDTCRLCANAQMWLAPAPRAAPFSGPGIDLASQAQARNGRLGNLNTFANSDSYDNPRPAPNHNPRVRRPMPEVESTEEYVKYAQSVGLWEDAAREYYRDTQRSNNGMLSDL